MKALRSFETSGNSNSETQRPIPEDLNFEVWTDQHCNISIQIATFSRNVKFYKKLTKNDFLQTFTAALNIRLSIS